LVVHHECNLEPDDYWGVGEQKAVWVQGVAESAMLPAVPVGRQMYPPRQSLLLPHTLAQNRISVDLGAHRPSSRQISSAVQSLVGPFGQASAGAPCAAPDGQVIGHPASEPPSAPGAQAWSSQKGLQGLVRNWTGKYRTQVASVGQVVSLQPRTVQ
jgi:hypothetical protein